MRTFIVGLIGMAACTAFAASAEARGYRYCVTSPGYGYPGDCSYSTYRQCMASASGRLADCVINPRAAFSDRRRARDRRW